MIEIIDIARSWGAFQLRHISLSVDSGEYLVVLGPCGSGKTLLLETIAGLHVPDTGRIFLNGREVTHLPPEKRRIGLVYQHYALFPHLSVRANIAYGLRYLGLKKCERRRRVEEMLEVLDMRDLAGRASPVGLSGGEAQKVALARALAIHPHVLLLDEPFSSLDQQVRERIKKILPEIARERNIPVLHVTHDYTEATALADRIAVFQNGRVVQVGTPQEVFRQPRTRFVAEFLGVENLLPATIQRVEADQATVRIGDCEWAARNLPPSSRLRPGRNVLACVRPEVIRLGGGPAPDSFHRHTGRLRELADLGFHVRARIVLGGIEITAFISPNHPALAALRVGGPVSIEIPPESLYLLWDAPHGEDT